MCRAHLHYLGVETVTFLGFTDCLMQITGRFHTQQMGLRDAAKDRTGWIGSGEQSQPLGAPRRRGPSSCVFMRLRYECSTSRAYYEKATAYECTLWSTSSWY